MKRYLYLWHRWLGIGLCLFMALWFFSGVVMLYVGYPKLTPREHLAHLPVLNLQGCCVDLRSALAAADPERAPSSICLSTVAGTPRYLLGYSGGANVAVDARSGQRLGATDRDQALTSAYQYDPLATARYQGEVQEDLWTHSRALDADRPLQRVQLNDAQGTLLYVSGQTGEVVRDASAVERGWNLVGAWLHWLYPLRGIGLDGLWSNLVIYLSLGATLMALLGAVIGVLRWRLRKPYRSGSRSPYRGFARWHHIGGLVFGVLAITWIFSGLMSMNPWRLFSSDAPLNTAAYQGGVLQAEAFPVSAQQAIARFADEGFVVRELEWRLIGGTGYLVGHDGGGRTRLLADGQVLGRLPKEVVEGAAQAILPTVKMHSEQLDAYDFYYYARAEQSMLGHLDKRLPVLRVRFDDPQQSWLHLDLYTGELLGVMDQPRRASRWLFALLHSWDWLPLLERRPLWDVWMVVLSIGGLVISVSGIVLGWRRLRH
ncbi:PepSY domain-containing protein [Pseudomonas sp. JQ170]|uniref:PepSY domain-containing protein n=1 Tax=unclassified Pseudomonas TaxID=196821 RepID=UPI0026510B6B|nr:MULTISPECIES: PepSY domain-containing protein [unclassified Pseudomonas]MDN7139083.1 PepSY domain-containing protein [Pseudomonas sp. JQ170]WRO77590.1 PepSY domain-containing protein [Pseudomonas sp. 170C]